MPKHARCRVCSEVLFSKPLLHYKDMPNAAQGFPDDVTVSEDHGVDIEEAGEGHGRAPRFARAFSGAPPTPSLI